MRPTHTALLAAACAALAACATEPPLSPEDEAQLHAVECESKDRCDALWQSAQLWVVNHAAYKIQISTDVVIQTFGAPPGSMSSGITVTSDPLGGGRRRINLRTQCGNKFSCRPSDMRLRVSFNRALRETPL